MIVEFVGIPGSGKTTLCRSLQERLRSEGREVVVGSRFRQPPRMPSWLPRAVRTVVGTSFVLAGRGWAITRYRGAFLVALRALYESSRGRGDKVSALRFFAVTLDNYAQASTRPYGDKVCLLEEGIIQRAFLLFVDGSSAEPGSLLRRYTQVIPVPDLVLYMDVPASVARSRVNKRGRGLPPRLQHLDEQAALAVMDRGDALLRNVMRGLREHDESRPEVIEVTAAEQKTSADRLCRAIVRLLEAP